MTVVKEWLIAVLWAAVSGLACAAVVLVFSVGVAFVRTGALSAGALIMPLAVGAVLLAIIGAAMTGPKRHLSMGRFNGFGLIMGALWVIGLLFWFGSVA